MSRGSFGFKGINGKAIKLTVEKRVSDKVMDKRAAKRMQKKVVAMMNRAGRKAAKKAKDPRWTPKLTGRLIASIRWEKAKLSARGNIIRGVLMAGGTDVPYARRQEFEHRTKSHYLLRAIVQIAQPAFQAELRKNKIYDDAFVGGIGFG